MFFSDIHGNSYAFEEFLKQSDDLGIDQYIFCGDIFGYYYGQNEIIDKLRLMKNLHVVKGNHDQYYLDLLAGMEDEEVLVNKYGSSYKGSAEKITAVNQEFVRKMPDSTVLYIEGKAIGIFHGSLMNPLNGRVYPDTELLKTAGYDKYDYVIHGHTHYRMNRRIGSTTVINPGSIGQPRDTNGFSFATLVLPSGKLDFHEVVWNRELLLKDIETNDQGNEKLKDILFRNEEKKL